MIKAFNDQGFLTVKAFNKHGLILIKHPYWITDFFFSIIHMVPSDIVFRMLNLDFSSSFYLIIYRLKFEENSTNKTFLLKDQNTYIFY